MCYKKRVKTLHFFFLRSNMYSLYNEHSLISHESFPLSTQSNIKQNSRFSPFVKVIEIPRKLSRKTDGCRKARVYYYRYDRAKNTNGFLYKV